MDEGLVCRPRGMLRIEEPTQPSGTENSKVPSTPVLEPSINCSQPDSFDWPAIRTPALYRLPPLSGAQIVPR